MGKEHLIFLKRYLSKLIDNKKSILASVDIKNVKELLAKINSGLLIINKLINFQYITEEERAFLIDLFDSFEESEKNIDDLNKDIVFLQKWGAIYSTDVRVRQIILYYFNVRTLLENKREELNGKIDKAEEYASSIKFFETILDSFTEEKIILPLDSEHLFLLFSLISDTKRSKIIIDYVIDIIRDFTVFNLKVSNKTIVESVKDNSSDQVASEGNINTTVDAISEEKYKKINELILLIKNVSGKINKYLNEYYVMDGSVAIDGKTILLSRFDGYKDSSKTEKIIDYIINSGLVEDTIDNRNELRYNLFLACLKRCFDIFTDFFSNDASLNTYLESYSVEETILELQSLIDDIISLLDSLDSLKTRKNNSVDDLHKNGLMPQGIVPGSPCLFLFFPSFDKDVLALEKSDLGSVEKALTKIRKIGPEVSFSTVRSFDPISCNLDRVSEKSGNKKRTVEILKQNQITKNNHFRCRQGDVRVAILELIPEGEKRVQLETELGRKFGHVCLLLGVWHENSIDEGKYTVHNDFIADNIELIQVFKKLFHGSQKLTDDELKEAVYYLKNDTIYDDFYSRIDEMRRS